MHPLYKAALILTALFFLTGPAQACRFKPDERPLVDRMADYHTVFIGSVMDAVNETGTGNTEATFTVQLAIKGALQDGDTVKVESHEGSCALRYEAGQVWLVVAGEEKTPYTTHMADASLLIADEKGRPVAGWEIIKPLLTKGTHLVCDHNICHLASEAPAHE